MELDAEEESRRKWDSFLHLDFKGRFGDGTEVESWTQFQYRQTNSRHNLQPPPKVMFHSYFYSSFTTATHFPLNPKNNHLGWDFLICDTRWIVNPTTLLLFYTPAFNLLTFDFRFVPYLASTHPLRHKLSDWYKTWYWFFFRTDLQNDGLRWN